MSASTAPETALGIPGFTFADLHQPARLRDLHDRFVGHVQASEPELWAQWEQYRSVPEALGAVARGNLVVAMAPHVSRFITRLFGVGAEADAMVAATRAYDVLFRFKIDFVRRRALPLLKGGAHVTATAADHAFVDSALVRLKPDATGDVASGFSRIDDEMALAQLGCALLDRDEALRAGGSDADKAAVTAEIDALKRWCAAHLHDPRYRGWVAFRFPENLDYDHLVQIRRPVAAMPEQIFGPEDKLRRRQGFELTDPRFTPRETLSEIHYCVLCHERDKDTCSKGIRDKEGTVSANPLGIPMPGCPLDEKISEMHTLRKRGDAIGALAIVTVDNPMVPGTGHRICNDCMKACIYQKQEPVNIPQVETGLLTDVLKLPWGVEIYGLLTRWNPLNPKRPYALPYNGRNVLVVGLGPAGYTLSHYLLNEGFGVVAIDGLKIEPLPEDVVGTPERGALPAVGPRPIQSWSEIYRPLDERVLEGFGGVSEYGITVRWDKNFLTLIHLTLARRNKLKIYGGVRFGGALPIDEAWGMGIDHVAIAAGAGRPTIIDIKNNLIRGIRKASDFLMALQLTGAFKRDTLSNLQARLPAVVIGGGLTGVDTATELMAYYPIQVEKTLDRYEALVRDLGEARVRGMLDHEEQGILDEFLGHGRAVRVERARAAAADELPNFIEMIRGWGGVTLAYRKRLQDAPAYRLNHEEVAKALEEGISVTENVNPIEAVPDEFGHVKGMIFTRADGATVELPARTVLVAAGTVPNITYEKEHPGSFELDGKRKFFKGFRAVPEGRNPETVPEGRNFSSASSAVPAKFRLEPDANGFFTSHDTNGKFVSYYGDNHPRYNGNVVKAMASAKDGYRHVVALFEDEIAALNPAGQPSREGAWQSLVSRLDDQLLARVERVVRLTPTIIEVIVRAPLAARHFHPGQFYRLQNFERLSPHVRLDHHVSSMLMEGIALTGAWVDREKGLLSLITLEMGVSSRLCAYLKPGEPVVVMGPTGTPTEIPEGSAVLLAGGGLGNAVLFSIAKALKAQGNRVIYFAGYKNGADLFKREDIEAATDQVIWATDVGNAIEPHRPQDVHCRGNIVQAMVAYAEGQLGATVVPLKDVTRIIAIGSDRMMNAVRLARHGALQPYLDPKHVGIGSINSPMQCMMKEVCAQCLQRHVDPETGREEFIFSCYNQDQELDRVDFDNLRARLRQNSVQEKISNLWFEHLLDQAESQLVHV
ncbi:MAG: FAD-dependent oxidoreductase [Vicinamibacterales bacterium]|jgi:NADPH-dependent glutamate synthase beta subunit-like oxidoreductase/NAD(P)H-flavin reductase